MQKYAKIDEKQQIMREYAINDKICENIRDFEKYAKSHIPHLNSALDWPLYIICMYCIYSNVGYEKSYV